MPRSTDKIRRRGRVTPAIAPGQKETRGTDDEHAVGKRPSKSRCFINIDCGIPEGSTYTDAKTIISYISDAGYVDTGTNHNIASNYFPASIPQLSNLRSFPKGIKNCYTIKPEQANGNKYLIRAMFMYGNYDSKDETPEFDLYLDGDRWDTIKISTHIENLCPEIIHVPATGYIHICLVNTGHGTPFISALELRQLDNSIYRTKSGSLNLIYRIDVGSTTYKTVRYPDDIYDRFWLPDRVYDWNWLPQTRERPGSTLGYSSPPDWELIQARDKSSIVSSTNYQPPSSVMATAVRPFNGSNSLNFSSDLDYWNQQLYVYMHFLEIETVGDYRDFDVFLNDELWNSSNVLEGAISIFITVPTTDVWQLNFSIRATKKSTLPPILNAVEVYEFLELPQSPTNQSEVDAIWNIKSAYRVEKNWQGDPCVPKNYSWDGLQCNSTRIISLNLSSSSLSGYMNISFSGLESLELLDLSNNNLTGPVPDFLTQLPFLKALNLSHNNFTGSVPSALIEKSKTGSLALSVEGNPHLFQDENLSKCQADSCAKKKDYVVPVIASIASFLVIVIAILAIWWSLKRKKQREDIVKFNVEDEMVEKNRYFTYSELITITNNFQKVLGKGASGSVYAGHLTDGTQVAVKMLSPQSTQGPNQFRTEARENSNILSWEGRLRIACDAAQDKKPLKPSNIGIKFSALICNGQLGTPETFSLLTVGKPPVLRTHENTHIVKWVMPMVERAEIKEIVDSRLNGDFDTNCAWKVVEIAITCVEHNSIRRPAMRQVVAEVRECVEMEIDRVKDRRENEAYNSASGSSFYVSLGSSVGAPSVR
ncbi:hypothetical protein Vadar_034086 [Vaccinium darrowii]|uniref:Uncharacterized protein n=1 Tax=Vaccinium darrowii TaxID=229202 RepID=A0ACB7ZN44_9ERIC|nr:hypothetical protein Vadar_034086 [Vaccinium darrowii]